MFTFGEDMSPAFRRKLREEIKIPEQPVKHQEHVAELAKRVADMEPHERTLIRLSIDPRYAADGRKTSIIFEPVAIVPKNVDGKNVLQMLRGNSIEDFVDFGGLDNIVGVSGYAYTRTGRKIPIIVKKWEFSPSYPDARELFGLGTIYLAPGNRKALIRGKLGRLTGIQVVGRGLTPDDYLMNMIRLYAEQSRLLGKREPPIVVKDYYPPNVAKVIGWFDLVTGRVSSKKDVQETLNKILGTAIEETRALVQLQKEYTKIRGSSLNAREFLEFVDTKGAGETGIERARAWFESMLQSPQFWRWATARFRHLLPKSRAKQMRKFVLSALTVEERLHRLRVAEKHANAMVVRQLI